MEIEDEGGAGLPDEMAAELRQLEAGALEDEGATPAVGGEGGDDQTVLAVPLSQELTGMLSMLSKLAAPIFPSLGAIYTDEVCATLGGAIAPVCEKHGWLTGGIGGEYAEELMCLVVVGPIAYATYAGVSGDLAERARAARAKQAEQGRTQLAAAGIERPAAPVGELAVPGQKTVTFGAPEA